LVSGRVVTGEERATGAVQVLLVGIGVDLDIKQSCFQLVSFFENLQISVTNVNQNGISM
jgi:hypothetical protein